MNKTDQMLLDLLREKYAEEPPQINSEEQVGHHLEVVARNRDEWERSVSGLRMLLGVRLVNAALNEERT